MAGEEAHLCDTKFPPTIVKRILLLQYIARSITGEALKGTLLEKENMERFRVSRG